MSGFRDWGWRGPGPPLGVPFGLNNQSPQAQGLVAWWPGLGSAGANVLRDFSGRGLHGTFKGPGEPAWAGDAQSGTSLSFDGVDDYVSMPYSSAFDILPSSMFSVSVWAKSNTALAQSGVDQRMIITRRGVLGDGVDEDKGWGLFPIYYSSPPNYTGNMLEFAFWTGQETNAPFTIAAGVWNHFVVIGNGSSVKLYANGSELTAQTFNSGGSIPSSSTTPHVGNWQYNNNWGWNGTIGEVHFFNRALSAAEVWQMWDPATRRDLYRPLVRRVWYLPIAIGGARRVFIPDLGYLHIRGA